MLHTLSLKKGYARLMCIMISELLETALHPRVRYDAVRKAIPCMWSGKIASRVQALEIRFLLRWKHGVRRRKW